MRARDARHLRLRFGPRLYGVAGLGSLFVAVSGVLFLFRGYAHGPEQVGLRVFEITGLVLAAIILRPSPPRRPCWRWGAATSGVVVETVSYPGWKTVVYEYREQDDAGTERLRAQMRVPRQLPDRLDVSAPFAVYYSRWQPTRSVAEALSVYEVVPSTLRA